MINNDIDLRPLSDNGFIRFTIKAPDTKDNEFIHGSFKQFCRDNAKDDYTFGLRLLLENLDYVHSINSLWDKLEDLSVRVSALEKPPEPSKEVDSSKGFF